MTSQYCAHWGVDNDGNESETKTKNLTNNVRVSI